LKQINSFTVLVATISSLTFFILGAGFAAFTEFDSTFGDMATWIAAIGTVSTLAFAIRQNQQLRIEQKKEKEERKDEEAKQRKDLDTERKKREEHEKKQQEMWELQREIASLQKYDAHKQMFFNLLSQLEQRFRHTIEFYDKDATYNNLFPENNIEHCVTKIDLNSLPQQSVGTLKDCLDCYDFLHKRLEKITGSTSKDYYNNAHDLMFHLLQMSSLLGINFKDSCSIGYISPDFDKQTLLVNIFDPSHTFYRLEKTLKRICTFVSISPPPDISYKAGGAFLLDTFLYFTLEPTCLRGYLVHFGDHEKTLRYMYKCYKIFERPEFRKEAQINSHYLVLCNLFTDKSAFYQMLDSKNELHQLFEEFLHSLAELDDSIDKPSEISTLRKDIRELTYQLKSKRT
jgi:hypothetical protein